MSDNEELETALRALGARLDVPEPPSMTTAVLASLDANTPVPARWRLAHRIIAAAVAALLALATAMVVSPAVRAAVFDLLRIGGVEIHENAPPSRPPSTDPVLPGEHAVTLDQARAAARFDLALPTGLGEPTAVRLIDDARVVSMTFGGSVRVDQFDGGLDPMFAKFVSADDVHHVTVAGVPGVWVDRPHPVFYLDRDGRRHEEAARLAGSTLIWEKDGVTYRVEGELTEAQAIGIAESMRR